jgi:hypothetical protein
VRQPGREMIHAIFNEGKLAGKTERLAWGQSSPTDRSGQRRDWGSRTIRASPGGRPRRMAGRVALYLQGYVFIDTPTPSPDARPPPHAPHQGLAAPPRT